MTILTQEVVDIINEIIPYLNEIKKDECILWPGSRHKIKGYGTLRIQYRQYAAHRVIWMIMNGKKKLDMKYDVTHTCGCKLCINPSHLIKMTHRKNLKIKSHNTLK